MKGRTRQSRDDAAASDREQGPDELWAPVVVGDPIHDFEPRPPAADSYLPDTISDGWSTEHVTMRLASVRGYAHRYRGIPRQDCAQITHHPGRDVVVFAVADGVSNARQGHIGASVACQSAIGALMSQLNSDAVAIDWEKVLHETAGWLTHRAATILRQDHADESEVLSLLATTLVAGYIAPTTTGPVAVMVQAGDTSAWLLRGGTYQCLLTDKHQSGAEVISSAVVPLPRLPDPIVPVSVLLPADAVLLIGTDGFGDPLGDGSGQVGKLFADWLATPPPGGAFAHLLDFSRETFDDDRTLLALWPRPASEEVRA